MIQIPKVEYEALLEELGILRNPIMMQAVKESDIAKKSGVKTWELKTFPAISSFLNTRFFLSKKKDC